MSESKLATISPEKCSRRKAHFREGEETERGLAALLLLALTPTSSNGTQDIWRKWGVGGPG